MGDDKSIGKALLGLFVQDEGEASRPAKADASSIDELLKRYGDDEKKPVTPGARAAAPAARPGAAAARSTGPAATPAAVPLGEAIPLQDGALPLARIYEAAGIATAAQEQVGKAQELLKGLPVDTPLAVKKTIVETALRAFGFPIAELVDTAHKEQQALDNYLAIQGSDTQQQDDADRARIEALRTEIAGLEQAIQKRQAEQTQATAQVAAAKATLGEVLSFFGPSSPATPAAG
jgi:hypothetical protein